MQRKSCYLHVHKNQLTMKKHLKKFKTQNRGNNE